MTGTRALGRGSLAIAIALATLVAPLAWITTDPAVAAPPTGPVIQHVPVGTANYGQPVRVSGSASCSVTACVVTVLYRETPIEGGLPPSLAGGGWTQVVGSTAPGQSGPEGRYSVPFAVDIPGAFVTTAGVDYFIEAAEPEARTSLPGTTSTSIATSDANSYFHVDTLKPPLLTHVGPAFAQVDHPVDLELKASCSTSCTATLYWRTTESGIGDEPLLDMPDWPNEQMEPVDQMPLAPIGSLVTFRGTIPASYIDTRGVDYFLHVTDGTTDAWWPGTTYQGFYAPSNGMRTGWHHVNTTESPHIMHAPVLTAPYRQPIRIDAQANCPSAETCEGTLYYRTTQRTAADPDDNFATTPMSVTILASTDGDDVISLSGSIPASDVDTRGVDYFFSAHDGATTSWWPGTTHVDGYAPIDGTRVAYQHTRVLEPPHVTHVPPVATPVVQPLTIEAQINCATDSCAATLWWASRVGVNDAEGLDYQRMPMQPTGPGVPTPAGSQQSWTATIPAEDVTTTGLAYWIEATDGYTKGFAPGSSYWGAYMPLDGQRAGDTRELDLGTDASASAAVDSVGTNVRVSPSGLNFGLAFPVRVLEPPHPVHAPPASVERRREVSFTMTTNCAMPSCAAQFTYSSPGRPPRTVDLESRQLIPASSPAGQMLEYSITLERSDVEPGLSYSFSVNDGYVTAATPTYSPPLSDTASGGIVGDLLWRDIDGDGVRDGNEPPLANARVTVRNVGLDGVPGTLDDLPAQSQQTDSSGMFEFHQLTPGTYQLAVDRSTIPPGISVSSGTDPRLVVLGTNQQHRDLDVGFRYQATIAGIIWSDADADGVHDAGEPGLAGLDVIVSHDGADGIPGTDDDERTWRAVTGADGKYQAVDLPPGPYTVTVTPPMALAPGATAEQAVTLGTTTTATGADLGLIADSPLAPLPAPPGVVQAVGPDGTGVAIDSNGGINPWDVRIHRAPEVAATVQDILASPAFAFTIPESAPAFNSATITLPYDEGRLGDFPENDLRIHHFNEETGLWESAGDDQTIDTVANTVTVGVSHFSDYAVLMLDAAGWARYWANNPLRCLAPDAPDDPQRVTLELSLVIDDSSSMSSSDSNNLRLTESRELIDHLRALGDYDWVEVVSFTTIARRRAPFTRLLFPDGIKEAISSIADDDTGSTDIGAGVRMALGDFAQHSWAAPGGIARAMVLLSDGAGAYDPDLTLEAIRQGVVIHTVTLGSSAVELPGDDLLQSIADDTGGEHFVAPAAADLADVFADLAPMIRDDGEDSDGDDLSDCVERYGMLSSWGFYDGSPAVTYNPFYGDRIVTSEPNDSDTDDDGLTDGEEMLGLELGEPRDLRDYPSTKQEYAFLINAGITRYYGMRSDPRVEDTDGDTLVDDDETRGRVESIDGKSYDTRADRPDTDLDGADDWYETQVLGTHPRVVQGNEFDIDDLPQFTLFQPEAYSGVAVQSRYIANSGGDLEVVIYNPYPVEYDNDFNCTRNCEEIEAEASGRDGGDWCWTAWDRCRSEADRERDIIRLAVDTQRIWNKDGTFREDFVATQGVADCLASHEDTSDCNSAELADAAVDDSRADDDSYSDAVAEVLLQIPGGYRPRDLCPDGNTLGGVYKLVDAAGVTRYVGETSNFVSRWRRHLQDPRFTGLTPVEVWRVPNYQVRRGLEQHLYNLTWGDVPIGTAQANGSLNGQRPMASLSTARPLREPLVNRYLDEC